MNTKTDKHPMPPYVPYSTLFNFISDLHEHPLPSHIDKSMMTKMSGSGQSAMIAAFKSLKLVNSNSEPTEVLKNLVESPPDEYEKILAEIVKSTYSFLFTNDFDIKSTTSKQVETKFRDFVGASGSTLTKCITFFLAAAQAAKIPVSPHVKAPTLQRSNGAKKKKQKNESNKPAEQELRSNYEDNMDESQTRFVIPLKGSEDGLVLLPKNLNEIQAKKAVKMINFILENYYETEE